MEEREEERKVSWSHEERGRELAHLLEGGTNLGPPALPGSRRQLLSQVHHPYMEFWTSTAQEQQCKEKKEKKFN